MQTLVNLLTALLPLLYGLATVNYQVYFVRSDPFAERTSTPFLTSTVAIHGVFLVLRVLEIGRPPIVGFGEAMGLVAFALAAVYLYVERIEHNRFTGAFILPVVVVLQLLSSTLSPQVAHESPSALLHDPLFGLHAVIALLGYSAFFLATLYGLMYLLLYRALKRKRFGLVFERLPPLDRLASMGFWAMFFGWLALTVAMALGIAMSLGTVPGFATDPKFFTSVAVWTVYGLGVLAHFALGWRGARSVYASFAGFVFAVAAMVGSNFIWTTFHSFQA